MAAPPALRRVITGDVVDELPPEDKDEVERLLRRRMRLQGRKAPMQPWPTQDPQVLLQEIAPHIAYAPLAAPHIEFWQHVMAIEPGVRPDPLVALWSRGLAKSASAELAAVLLGGEGRRFYCVYVSGVQALADDHVGSISAVLESASLAAKYPLMADRKLGKYGPRSWRRERLEAASGFTCDAVGLDAATRGRRIEAQRPDLIVLDDIDAVNESVLVTLKKLRTITGTIIPMGSPDVAFIFAQNLIHENSIARRIAEPEMFPEREHLFLNAKVIGPVPAVDNLQTVREPNPDRPGRMRIRIVGGEATWEGLDLEACQGILNSTPLAEFKREYQHDMTAPAGGIFSHLEWTHVPWEQVPWGRMIEIQVWVDPAVTAVDGSDAQGIQADGVDTEGNIWRLFSFEQVIPPDEAIATALTAAHTLGATAVGVETDQGGDTWLPVFREARRRLIADEVLPSGFQIMFKQRKAGSIGSKVERAQEMVLDYGDGIIKHVTGGPFSGSYLKLEAALHRFPLTKPLDLVDAAVWSWREMRRLAGRPVGFDRSIGESDRQALWRDPGGDRNRNGHPSDDRETAPLHDTQRQVPEPTRGAGWNPAATVPDRQGWSP